jgi:hypothetical protein
MRRASLVHDREHLVNHNNAYSLADYRILLSAWA